MNFVLTLAATEINEMLRRQIIGDLPDDFFYGLRFHAQQNDLRISDSLAIGKRRSIPSFLPRYIQSLTDAPRWR